MKIFLILLAFTVIVFSGLGQAAKKSAQPQSGVPKLVVSLGGNSGGNLNTDLFVKLVDSALSVKDEKGNKYTITRFRINYSFQSTYRDSETDEVKTMKDLRVYDFYDTPMLSEVWRASIRDNAKKGDEVIINNVIVKLKNGKKFMAPEWKATLK
jgi:hypothetical protein